MASGFDSTAFSNGILGNVNNQYAQQRQNQQKGDEAQYQSFIDASREYDQAKAKQGDQQAKVDALANVISGGKPDAPAYATARDAVELGYTDTEHLPYVMEAYKNTKKMADADPESWTGVKPQTAAQKDAALFGPDPTQDSNPDQTRAIRKFGNNAPQEDIEDIRNHNLQRPYQNLPGAAWGNAEDTANRLTQEKTQASEAGRITAEGSPAALKLKADNAKAAVTGQLGAYGYIMGPDGQPTPSDTGPTPKDIQNATNTNNQVQAATPQSGANQPPPNANPLAVPASQLQPPQQGQAPAAPAPSPQISMGQQGMQANVPPPGQNPTTGATQPNTQSFDVSGSKQGQPMAVPAQIPTSQKPESYPALPKQQMGTALDFKALEAQGNLNPSSLDKLTPADANYVRSMVAGLSTPITSTSMARNPHNLMLQQAAHAYDASYSDDRFKDRNAFLHGPEADNLRNLNTTYNHFGLMVEAGNQLKNGSLPALNGIAKAIGAQEGQSPPVVYDNIKHYISSEMNRFYSGGKPNLASLEAISSSMDKAQSPEQMDGVMATNMKLLDGAADSYDNQYRGIMGNVYSPTGFLSKTAQGVRDQLTARYGGQGSANQQSGNQQQQNVMPQTQDLFSKHGF